MFFKSIFIIFGIYLLANLIIRGLSSYFIENATREENDLIQRQHEKFVQKKKKKGDHITINYQPKSQKSFGKEVGDYIDFEEVK